jgi:hypothetical protein
MRATAMTAGLEMISLDLIRLDEAVWPRSSFDHGRIEEFTALYAAEGLEALPPAVVVADGAGRYLLCDGHHRVAALYALDAQAAATRTEGLPPGLTPEQFAFEYAVASAARTAKPLTRGERNCAVDRLLDERPDLSDRRIADVCGVSHQTVGRRRTARSNGPSLVDRADTEGAFRRTSEREAAERLLKALEKMWEARGLGVGDFFAGRDRTGERLAEVLHDSFGEAAVKRAGRYQTWISDAIAALSAGPAR